MFLGCIRAHVLKTKSHISRFALAIMFGLRRRVQLLELMRCQASFVQPGQPLHGSADGLKGWPGESRILKDSFRLQTCCRRCSPFRGFSCIRKEPEGKER